MSDLQVHIYIYYMHHTLYISIIYYITFVWLKHGNINIAYYIILYTYIACKYITCTYGTYITKNIQCKFLINPIPTIYYQIKLFPNRDWKDIKIFPIGHWRSSEIFPSGLKNQLPIDQNQVAP